MQSTTNPIALIITIALAIQISYAQNNRPFVQDGAFYLKGGAITIGNNILSTHKTNSCDKVSLLNDNVNMTYIDIDDDPTTFSSSAVSFALEDKATIVSATLYWAATYSGETGSRKVNSKEYVYKVNKDRDKDINQIKFKTNDGAYNDILGTIIYDGQVATNSVLKNNNPYICKADVTHILAQTNIIERVTVANIAATEGFIEGGSAGGWLLYIIYEQPDASPQFITSFSGFEIVKEDKVTVSITDFKVPENSSSSTITIGALDGDYALKGDQVTLLNPVSKDVFNLKSKKRPKLNFFNSTMNLGEGTTSQRIPNSTNTLGFDIAQIAIETENILPKDADKINIVYTTKADGFYVFFTAFQTQIDEVQIAQKKAITVAQNTKIDSNDAIEPTKAMTTQAQAITATKTPTQPVVTSKKTQPLLNKISGFYVITNAFSNIENAYKWKLFLLDLGYQPFSFIHPVNKLEYVYIATGKNEEELLGVLQEALSIPQLSKTWIKEMD